MILWKKKKTTLLCLYVGVCAREHLFKRNVFIFCLGMCIKQTRCSNTRIRFYKWISKQLWSSATASGLEFRSQLWWCSERWFPIRHGCSWCDGLFTYTKNGRNIIWQALGSRSRLKGITRIWFLILCCFVLILVLSAFRVFCSLLSFRINLIRKVLKSDYAYFFCVP